MITGPIAFSFLGGAAVAALGALALVVKPRTAAAFWFGLFAVSFGSVFMVNSLANALVLARHDGSVTPEEARHLADAADALGLTHSEVARVRREVDEEIA